MSSAPLKRRNSRWDDAPVLDKSGRAKAACITQRDIDGIFRPLTQYRYLPVDYIHAIGGGSLDYLVNRLNLAWGFGRQGLIHGILFFLLLNDPRGACHRALSMRRNLAFGRPGEDPDHKAAIRFGGKAPRQRPSRFAQKAIAEGVVSFM
jgi:hypothetical protein